MNRERLPLDGGTRRDWIRAFGGILTLLLGESDASAEHRDAQSVESVELISKRMRLWVLPARGGSILAWKVLRRGEWVDVYPDVRDPSFKMRMASWLMLPYSNRIRNGAFSYRGRTYQLRNAESHAIHGDARNWPWEVLQQTQRGIELRLRTAEFSDFNWPWPMEAVSTIRLEDESMVQEIRVTNRGSEVMPMGFGWHPYYLRRLTRDGESVHLQVRCAGVWPDPDGDCLPDGPVMPLPTDLDFSVLKPIPTNRRYDVCLAGFDGRGVIEWPESGVRLEFECSEQVKTLVFFNPIERPVFAVEPVTNANDGINLMARGWADHGVVELPPGETITGWFRTRINVREP